MYVQYYHDDIPSYNNVHPLLYGANKMPRKSLTGSGESIRMNFRVSKEIISILDNVDNKSDFIREAIIHHWNRVEDSFPDTDDSITSLKDKNRNNIAVNGTWSPSWLSD